MLGAILGAAGALGSSLLANSAAKSQQAMQLKFAKKAIQWKVEDAKAAGIHPLYALGANTVSYSPVSVGTPDLGAMGQSIGGAIDRVSTAPERMGSDVLGKLAVERAGLENDLLRANIAKTRATTVSVPAMPGMIPSDVRNPVQTTGANIGVPFPANPLFSDAQTYEDRYGELGGSALGLINIPADLWHKFSPEAQAYGRSLSGSAPTHYYKW